MSYVLGLSGGYYHDSAACLVKNGEVLAFAEEERFTRRKHNENSRSCTLSSSYCLHQAGISLEDVDIVAISWNPSWPSSITVSEDRNLIQELLDPVFLKVFHLAV